MKEGFAQLKKQVVDRGLCTGCGTCAGICPEAVIEMTFVDGEPEPKLVGKCTQCGLCLKTCSGEDIPLSDLDNWLFGRTSSFHQDPLGIFRKSLRGYATDSKLREKASSGGITSAILNFALDRQVIDGAIVVCPDPEIPWRFSPALITESGQMNRAARSTVDMIPINALLRHAVMDKGCKKIGVVGLPCHMHSLRKIQIGNDPPEIAAAIKLCLGLFCAATYYFEGIRHMIAEFAGIENIEDIVGMDYRGGQWPGALTVMTKEKKIVHVSSKHEYTWHFLGPATYKRDRCLMCPDYSARIADLAMGDIFQKIGDNPNLTAVLARTELGEKIIADAMADGYIHVEDHPAEYIPKSGMGWESKEHAGIFRSRSRKRFGWPTPDFQYPLEMCPLPGKIVFP